MSLRFALVGAAGYIAPRHMKAIRETKNDLVLAFDPNDSVGVIDSHFPRAEFYVQYEQFETRMDELTRENNGIDYVTVCSPNYLHAAHIRSGLRNGADVICEKPLVLAPEQITELEAVEADSPGKVSTILQLRLHPSVIALREEVMATDKKYDIQLTYITSRGKWYDQSWKADQTRSGGIASNIGVHFFDMLHWVFGPLVNSTLHYADPRTNAGLLETERARVQWLLSIDDKWLPEKAVAKGMRTFRSLEIDGKELEFSDGFTDLHTRSYEAILAGNGFGLKENLPSIQTVFQIRNLSPIGLTGDYHPSLRNEVG